MLDAIPRDLGGLARLAGRGALRTIGGAVTLIVTPSSGRLDYGTATMLSEDLRVRGSTATPGVSLERRVDGRWEDTGVRVERTAEGDLAFDPEALEAAVGLLPRALAERLVPETTGGMVEGRDLARPTPPLPGRSPAAGLPTNGGFAPDPEAGRPGSTADAQGLGGSVPLPDVTAGPAPQVQGPEVVTMRRTPEEYEDLAKDPARGGAVTPGSIREREVILGLEAKGTLPGPVVRDQSGAADFIDATGRELDVKGFRSDFPANRGGFDLERDVGKIERELMAGHDVVVDTGALSAEHERQLREEVDRRGIGDRVMFGP